MDNHPAAIITAAIATLIVPVRRRRPQPRVLDVLPDVVVREHDDRRAAAFPRRRVHRLVEDHVVDPTFICDLPIEMSPLAKTKRGAPVYSERFEAVVCGFELVNAFSELNDPIDQWTRFAAQEVLREEGDEDAMSIDEDYIRALEYGLPPTGGFGMGVDRLVMLLTGQTTVREVVLFPMLRSDEGA